MASRIAPHGADHLRLEQRRTLRHNERMIVHRNIAVPVLLTLFAVVGCAAEQTPAPVEAAAAPETMEQRCSRMRSVPHTTEPPEKIAGDPAVLTPEAESAGIRDALSMTCGISLHGRVMQCEMPPGSPPSLEGSVRSALDTWRFRPATYDGVPVAQRGSVTVPLVRPPPGWVPPAEAQVSRSTPFGQGMTAPTLIAGRPQPTYTREALEHCAEGKVIARCMITVEGRLTDCDIVQSIPYEDQSVLSTLAQQRYTPVMYAGRPQAVFYTLTFRFKLRR